MPAVTYIGTPDDSTQTITHGGVTFERGKSVTVNKEQMEAGAFDTNPTFTTKADDVKKAAEADDAAEHKRLTVELEKRSVPYDGKLSNDKLSALLDDALLAEAKA